jgi:hypothetical protein
VFDWFLYQQQNQCPKDYLQSEEIFPLCNIAISFHDTINKIIELYSSARTTKKVESVFSKFEQYRYVDSLSPNVPEVSKDLLEKWIHNDKYAELLERQSHETVYFHEQEDFDLIMHNFCASIGVKKYKSKGLTSLKLHVSHPGQMFPLHFDRPQNVDFSQPQENKHFSHKRYFVFLKDQQPGQVFQVGNCFLRWKKGDVFDYDQKNDMHGGANFGYWPRFMLLITIQVEQ